MTEGSDLGRLASAPRQRLTVTAFRHQSPRRDPRSGEGARIHGGRFNPPDSYPTLYLCETRDCVVAELTRQSTRNVVGLVGLLPRSVYRYDLDLTRVLDLTDVGVLDHLEISPAQLVAADWNFCQTLGAAAYRSGDQAIRFPSATGVDNIVAVFTELSGDSLQRVALHEEWSSPTDL